MDIWLIVGMALLILDRVVIEVRRWLRVGRAKVSPFKRVLQQTDKQGGRLVYVRVEVNGEGFLSDTYEDPKQYITALARALAEADSWLHEYAVNVGTKEARQ